MASSGVARSQNTLSRAEPSAVEVLLDIVERSMHGSRSEWLFLRELRVGMSVCAIIGRNPDNLPDSRNRLPPAEYNA